jgi:hypothetical protein
MIFNSTNSMMKTAVKIRFALIVMAALAAPLMAFTLRGGDSFEIFVGKTRAVQQFIHMDNTVKTVDLSTAALSDELRVTFSHCGQTGTNRRIALKHNQQILKEWKFADIKPGGSPIMTVSVRDIVAVQKSLNVKNISLLYSSDSIKEGRVLVTLASNSAQGSAK